jgi:hypothetical protein
MTLFLSFQCVDEKRPIRLETLKPNQEVQIEWQLPGEYSLVQDYKLTFSVSAGAQVEAKNLLKTGDNSSVTIYLSREELKALDKALTRYREQKVVLCSDMPAHNIIISLREGDRVKAQESFNNRCLHSKLSELINSLEQQAALNDTGP